MRGAGALARVLSPSPPQPGYAPRVQRSETHFDYKRGRAALPTLRLTSQRAFNRFLRQRRHNRVPSSVRVQPIFRQIALQQPFLVHHCVEIIEINQSIGRAVIFQPAIQLQNLVRRPLRKQILRV